MGMVVKQPYILVSKLKKTKTRFLRCTGYSSSCTTTELSKLLTSCFTAVKISKVAKIRNRYNQAPHLKTCYQVL